MAKSTTPRNILLIMVDQLRFPRFAYGKDGGLLQPLKEILGVQGGFYDRNPFREYFPGMWSLRRNSVVLRNHTIAATACTPSRATIMTGQYGTRTGVTQTDGMFKSGDSPAFPWLAADGIPTLGHWFRSAGYRTHYFGKWHVSNPPDHTLVKYGFDDWQLSWPEPHGPSVNNLGAFRDIGFADLVCGFLHREGLGMDYNRALAQQQATRPLSDPPPTQSRPWFAVASFTNPHDIATYPAVPRMLDPQATVLGPLKVPEKGAISTVPVGGTQAIELNPMGFPQNTANLPPTVSETLHNKPGCQFDYSYKCGLGLAAKTGQNVHDGASQVSAVNAALLAGIPFQLTRDPDSGALYFLQYYAWLQQMVDGHIRRVLTALDSSGQRENTIVVFLADHGEYGAAHSYMIEKWHSAYQEALHVPVVIQSVSINPDDTPRQIDALTSHIDIAPTLLGLAGLDKGRVDDLRRELQRERPTPPFVGVDLTPLIEGRTDVVREPDGSVRQGVLFITDDEITQPLDSGADPYQVQMEQQFKVFLELVETVRQGGSAIPNSGPVERLAPGPVRQPNHVRCVRTSRWKLARYWDPSNHAQDEWELYDLDRDGCEQTNLLLTRGAFPTPIPDLPAGYTNEQIRAVAGNLRALLQKYEAEMLSAPREAGAGVAPASTVAASRATPP
ncbi:sulfatase-like hydrolase/transferase [Tahibacter amnicola]|uniref:Sulfatase-like hydrolase/transferase n=1 Tax=Tahibacter amnicola TaxID=2976241 RepID=A0ABY6BG23_9GAMM|nr:sulfatase-like hydrolase/transferase [Tahibacter amnicola]UXI68819.1 sulfatase-like hydrolase/transferase [Tahibacter amnicola]